MAALFLDQQRDPEGPRRLVYFMDIFGRIDEAQ
jgi:hypothetical protein